MKRTAGIGDVGASSSLPCFLCPFGSGAASLGFIIYCRERMSFAALLGMEIQGCEEYVMQQT